MDHLHHEKPLGLHRYRREISTASNVGAVYVLEEEWVDRIPLRKRRGMKVEDEGMMK